MKTKKLVISMLGLGAYNKETNSYYYTKANYCINDETTVDGVAYHQIVLKEAIGPDLFWLIGTVDAKEAHSTLIKDNGLDYNTFIEIPKGTNDQDFWDIFTVITQKLESIVESEVKFEIFLDLTHGFRVQPMFLLSAVRYYCQLHSNNFELKDIYYSMFEPRKEPETVFPILSVKPIMEMEVIAAEVRAFLEHGSSTALAQRIQTIATTRTNKFLAENPNLTGKEKGKAISDFRKTDPLLKNFRLKNDLEKFSAMIGFNYTPVAADIVRTLCDVAENAAQELKGNLAPLGQALSVLNNELASFFPPGPKPLWRWHTAIARWCMKRGFYQQALTHTNELLTTRLLELIEVDPLDVEQRNNLSNKLLSNEAGYLGPKPSLSKSLKEAVKLSIKVGEQRNKVNHAFCSKASTDLKKVEELITKVIKDVIEFHDIIDCKSLDDDALHK